MITNPENKIRGVIFLHASWIIRPTLNHRSDDYYPGGLIQEYFSQNSLE